MIDAQIGLIIWAGLTSIFMEIIAVLSSSKLTRKISYLSVVILCSFASLGLVFYMFNIATVLVTIIALFRVINALRVIEERMNSSRLLRSSRRTSIYLIAAQIVAALFLWAASELEVGFVSILYVLALTSALVSIVLLAATRRNLAKSSMRSSDEYRSDKDLPSVSICIPARNETEDLPPCLESIVRSDYRKLEILVLDDCSQDRTSEIIKGFAHDGVRFIPGESPAKGWLAKNQAYQALAEAASGEILVFCGVDTRLEKDAIRALVGSMISRKKQMISVLPKGLQRGADSRILQPMRYWWELALPRRLFNRPPVLSTTWAISRQAFFGLGEMKAVKNSIMPEGYFARELTKTDEYSFMRANGKLKISSVKRLPEQWQSSLRTRYPRLRNRPENVLTLVLLEVWLLLLPLAIFVTGYFINLGYIWLISGFNIIVLMYIHYRIVKAWDVSNPSLALSIFPAAILSEIIITLISMWKYEFSEIEWKDRNICIPVMQHYKKLPKA